MASLLSWEGRSEGVPHEDIRQDNIHDSIQVRHVRMVRSVEDVFAERVVLIDLGPKLSIRIGMREQAVENT